MKKCMLAMAVALVGLFVAGCGDPNIDTVKKGVLEVDETRTVEQLLSSKMDKMKWKTFTSDDNKTVVEVVGVWKDSWFRDNATRLWGIFAKSSVEFLPMPGDMVYLQFVMHANGTDFHFQYAEVRDSEGRKKHESADTSSEKLYYNASNFLQRFFVKF